MSDMKITLSALESAAVSAYRHQKRVYSHATKLMDMYAGVIAAAVNENGNEYLEWDNENLPESLRCEISCIRSDGKQIWLEHNDLWGYMCFCVRGLVSGDGFKGDFYEEPFDKLFSKVVEIVKRLKNVPHLANEDKLELCRSHYDAISADTSRESYFQSLFNKALADKLRHLPNNEYVLKLEVYLNSANCPTP